MTRILVLDSTPLGLLLLRRGQGRGEACRQWLTRHLQAGVRVVVPEIIDYEVRRELLRMNKSRSVSDLDAFISAETDRYLPLKTAAVRLAAELWARARRQGAPTADRHALDIDVILAAQALAEGWTASEFIVATSNFAHLARFVPVQVWSNI